MLILPASQVPGDQRGVTIAAWCISDGSGDADGVRQVVIADVLCRPSLDLCVEVGREDPLQSFMAVICAWYR